MFIKITVVVLIIVLLSIMLNELDIKLRNNRNKVNISFKESMDLTELPIITFYNNNTKLNFILDTGANTSAIDSKCLTNINYKPTNSTVDVIGIEGTPQRVELIDVSLKYKDREYKDTFQVVDLSKPFSKIKKDTGVNLSGILGNKFFTKYKYILDFDNLIAYSKK